MGVHLLMHTETDARHDPFDFMEAYETAPKDLSALLDAHESLPFRRRGYEVSAARYARSIQNCSLVQPPARCNAQDSG